MNCDRERDNTNERRTYGEIDGEKGKEKERSRGDGDKYRDIGRERGR